MVVTLEDRLVVGDGSALRDLFDQYAPLVAGIGRGVFGADDESASRAMTADVIAEAWNTRTDFDPSKGSVLAWIVSITRERLQSSLTALGRGDEDHDQLVDRSLIGAVMAAMPDSRSQILERGLFDEEGEEAIASQLDVPVGSVAGHLRVGLENLRDELSDSLPDDVDVMERLQNAVSGGRSGSTAQPVSSEVWDDVVARADLEDDQLVEVSHEDATILAPDVVENKTDMTGIDALQQAAADPDPVAGGYDTTGSRLPDSTNSSPGKRMLLIGLVAVAVILGIVLAAVL